MRSKHKKDRILVVNGSPEVREQLRIILGGIFDVSFVAGDDRALAMAKHERPCLILTEPATSNGEKFDLCRRVSREKELSATPVIVIIEREAIEDMTQGFYLGASDYVTKPLIAAEVLARIGGQLELASASKALKEARKREKVFARDAGTALDNLQQDPLDDEEEKQRILLVDDYPGNLDALTMVLEEFYDVTTATNGKDALALALNEPFDLIMLDVMMPEMDGYEVCRQLMKHEGTNEIPVIFVTGKAQIQDEARGLGLGAVDYISKPYSLAVVLARVRNHMATARSKKQLKSFSYIDGLTGLPNRRQFDEVLQKEWQRAIREQRDISVILIDVDNFKPYNDFYGHIAGDECLHEIARALGSCRRRASDFVGRYGGEEFVAILPNTNADGALHMAEEMLESVRALKIPHQRNPHDGIVTVSVGSATCAPTVDHTAKWLLSKADKLLYSAKQKGRNQVQTKAWHYLPPSAGGNYSS